MKLVIAGYPKTGKTTLADKLAVQFACKVFHTDDVIALGSHNDSQAVSEWFDTEGDWIIEGVIAPRAIRKWIEQHKGLSFPADRVAFFRQHVTHWENKGTFVKGLDTVWAEVKTKVELVSPDSVWALLDGGRHA